MNVLTKTCRGFVKRTAAYIVAGAVAATLIPAAVSAEETAAAPTLWETVSEISMDGFTQTKGSSWLVAGEKNVDERTVTVQTNAGGDPWIVCPESGFCDVASDADLAVNAPEITENGKLFVLNRKNGEVSTGWWKPTSIKSGIQALNLFDKTKIAAGDKIKITAYVYAKNICQGQGNYNNSGVDQTQNVSARIWLTEPWKSNSEPGYNTNCDPNKETFIGEIPAGKWSELSLEYTAGAGNMDINGIEINNYPGSKDGIYPLNLYLAGVKVERQTSVKSAYTKTLANINMDGFTKDTEKSGIWAGMFYDKTVDGWSYKVNGLTGSTFTVHGNTGIITGLSSKTGSVPAVTKNDTGFLMCRKWIDSAPQNLPLSNTAIEVQNMFDTAKLQNGDRLKITAYVYAAELATSTVKSNGFYDLKEGATGEVNYRMSLTGGTTEKVEFKDDAAEWKEISIEYVVNDANKTLNSIKIDNYVQNGEVYPLSLYLAGITVEKLENGGWYTADANGNAAGEIYASNAGASEGSKVMVAAYEGNTFLGCDILDVNSGVSPFSITGASKADKVCAYVWNMTTLKPQAGVIGLKQAE